MATATALGVAAVAISETHGYRTRRPNVLVIQPDQHRGTVMGCAGDSNARTPNLDRLAAEGIRFPRCVSASPVCSPFRATFQTGLYPHTHGVDTNGESLFSGVKGFAEIFASAGYATGYIGKWHIDGGKHKGFGGHVPKGRRLGWQEWEGYETGHSFLEVWRLGDRQEKERVEGYNWEPTWHTDMALDFAKRKGAEGKPWLYFISYGPPHNPKECLEKYLEMYPPESFTLAPDVKALFPDERQVRKELQMYYALVTAIDVEIGRLTDGLKKLGIDENTIILYTSDHGDRLGSHTVFGPTASKTDGNIRGKGCPYASAFRIPLIVRWPKAVKPGQVCNGLVSSVDLAPTLLDLAGLKVPETYQGGSMAGWCLGRKGHTNEAVYLGIGGLDPRKVKGKGRRAWRAVWDGRYLFAPPTPPNNYRHLYDHKTDPYEMTNLIDSPDHGAERKRMKTLLLELAKKTKDPMLDRLVKACRKV